MYDAPTDPYCIQVKLVGRREVENESQGEERNSSWKFGLRSVTLCDVTCHLKLCEKITHRLITYKIWLRRKQWSSKLTTLFASKFIGPFYCQSIRCRSWSSIELLMSESWFFWLGSLLKKLSLGSFLSLFPSCLLDVKRDDVYNVPGDLLPPCLSTWPPCCLAVSTRNRLCDGSFRGV